MYFRRYGMLLFWLIAIWCRISASCAEAWFLPSSMREIDAEAFSGCSQITEVSIPNGVKTIGERAFQNCTRLRRVVFPASIETIGDQALDGCAEALYILCEPETPAAEWAAGSGFDWDAGTVCRALVIGQSYTGTKYSLRGPVYDMQAVASCLRQMQTRGYTVTERTNLTAGGILSAIYTAFSGATANDISFLYYSGHGLEGGYLVGQDLKSVSPAALRSVLDQIPGRKVIFVDACFSGALLEDEPLRQNAAPLRTQNNIYDSFTQGFAGAFYTNTRSLKGTSYYVMTACQAAEESEEGYIRSGTSGCYMGFFTYALCQGCGWDGVQNQAGQRLADQNSDDVVTFEEAYDYAAAHAQENNPNQSAVVYPAQCTWFSPFRP